MADIEKGTCLDVCFLGNLFISKTTCSYKGYEQMNSLLTEKNHRWIPLQNSSANIIKGRIPKAGLLNPDKWSGFEQKVLRVEQSFIF